MLFKAPELLHIELTSRCPLRCSQCYCDLTNGKDFNRERLFIILQNAAEMKISSIALSGGEPLLYPHLIEAIEFIHKSGIYCTMATSGYGLTKEMVKALEKAGIDQIWISINGSNATIHNQSRDCFHESLEALVLLKSSSIKYGINWVARKDNVKDFQNVVVLAKAHGCQCINVLLLKPDSQMALNELLVGESFFEFADYLKSYKDEKLPIYVENCYAYLKAYLNKDRFIRSLFGCDAGRKMMAVSVEGEFMPCRHLFNAEKMDSMKDYWEKSDFLKSLRETDKKIQEPCKDCNNAKYCRSCRATAIKVYNDLYSGGKNCPIHSKD